ncbi:hypothetical protein [Parafilimonas terrae]|uniref:Uncharacterized protein n=1 Tax=Parafilimonas terrae TaxID=1465490 RepID=A0A1I5UAM5_9BACT|nr:hypothetical protein [Parafilimonas terrae]SFP92262.1 hypothetical protein SAMN05444277_103170 [Parafilimonas terrae]
MSDVTERILKILENNCANDIDFVEPLLLHPDNIYDKKKIYHKILKEFYKAIRSDAERTVKLNDLKEGLKSNRFAQTPI